jgi:hypothetical protein
MIEMIKEIVKNYLNSVRLTKLVSGKVESVSPLKVRINEKLLLPEALILWPPVLQPEDVGKSVLMIQQEGGQKFYILEVRP